MRLPDVVVCAPAMVAHNKNNIIDVRVLVDKEFELLNWPRCRDARHLNDIDGELGA